ncbi:MAG: hypothetical protein J6Q19_07735 [Bacteroidaceae bacterium]|nr:hypothetical protein [Bacteroidaceae bacterium]MBO7248013.1 hypothetical protein [Bacteroidaceae bacterium]MBO7261114.1 hypothetical protein [Bacteroidaceae bacterium]
MVADDINKVLSDSSETVIYDLLGRRVNGKVNSGIYIINGKKVVIR